MSEIGQNLEIRNGSLWRKAGVDLTQWQELYLVFAGSAMNGSLTVALTKLLVAAIVQYLRRKNVFSQTSDYDDAPTSASHPSTSNDDLRVIAPIGNPILSNRTLAEETKQEMGCHAPIDRCNA